jgi:hypothetical protein
MLRLHKASRETSQLGRLPAPSYLPRVNVYLPEIRTWSKQPASSSSQVWAVVMLCIGRKFGIVFTTNSFKTNKYEVNL